MKRVKTARALSHSLKSIAAKETEDDFLIICKKLAFDAFTDLVSYTPFDTGFAQSNWRVGINEKDEVTQMAGATGGSYSVASYGSPNIQFGDVINIYNNTVYIGRLDAGWSKQEPRGMIAPAFQRLTVTATRLARAESRRVSNV